MCYNITIVADTVLEDNEDFSVVISSTDAAVLIQSDNDATVEIIDTTGKHCGEN